MQAALDLTLEYTHTREQFNKKIGTFQLMQGKLAGEFLSIHMLRPLG
jgi:isovaleryl-CoA dehydrogenase